jgi:hypothetical protein
MRGVRKAGNRGLKQPLHRKVGAVVDEATVMALKALQLRLGKRSA